MISKKYRTRFREALGKALQGNPIKDNAWKYEKGEGKSVYVIARMHVVGGENGGDKECLVVNTDITDLTLRMKKMGLQSTEKRGNLGSLWKNTNYLR